MKLFRLALLLCFLAVPALHAHDFWIEPSSFAPAPGERITVRLRVGEHFRGDPVPRNPQRIERFAAVGAGGEAEVIGLPGRDPAGYASFGAPGLYWLVYDSNHASIESEGPKFESYLVEEGLERISALRAERGQGAARAREIYSRCAKSLISVGSAGGESYDRPLGLVLELIPESNPAAAAPGADLPVRLLYQGKPLAGVLVAAIPYDAPEAQISARSDAEGRVRLRLNRGGDWLVKAVHMIQAPEGTGADWESFWASLTFRVPVR